MSNGQSDIAAKITQLDPTSKTYLADVAKLQKQIVEKKTTTTSSETVLPATTSNIKLGIVGMTKQEATDIYSNSESDTVAPDWFAKQYAQEYQMSIGGQALNKIWNEYRKKIIAGGGGAKAGSEESTDDYDIY
jgi:predicted secreted protein